jgi:hypothetical protein
MTPNHFRIARNLTAAIVAVAMAGLLLLGFDGLLVAMRKLADVVSVPPAPPPVAAPPPAVVETPGVVQTFIVPASEEAPPDK